MNLFFSGHKVSMARIYKIYTLLVLIFCLPVFFIKSALGAYTNQTDEDGVIYPSNYHTKREVEKNNEYRDPDAYKVRFRPIGNDPKRDPLNQSYEEWLEESREDLQMEKDMDEKYETFIKEISPLIFSLGHKELTPEMKDLFANIPANSLGAVGNQFAPKGPIDVERAQEARDPFGTESEPEEEILGHDIGLNIDMQEPGNKTDELMGMAYDALRAGQVEGAAALYQQVIGMEPEHEQALFGLATTYHRSGQFEAARENYITLLSKDPNNWPALNNLMVLAGEEAPEDALKELKKLEMINPEFSPIAAQIGIIYLRLNNPEEAVKYLTRAIILSPDNLAYRYNLAVVLDNGGYKQQAARLYQQLLEAHGRGESLPESVQRIRERLAFITSSPIMVR